MRWLLTVELGLFQFRGIEIGLSTADAHTGCDLTQHPGVVVGKRSAYEEWPSISFED